MTQVYIERYWRDAELEDAIKEPPMVARFRDKDEDAWHFDALNGWNRRSLAKWLCGCLSWRFCQVYDAPDPGEGWRLIDVATEKWQDGDEIYEKSTGTWKKRLTPFQDWALSFNRRRITPIVTYVPFTWEDRDQLRGRWMEQKTDSVMQQQIAFKFENDYRGLVVNGIYGADHLLEHWKFLDTGKPVGKEVVQ